jgi:hypothetical protein
LQLDDCTHNAKPDQLPAAFAAFEHLIGTPGCHYLSVASVLTDQQICGTPDVAIGDHSGSLRSVKFLTLGDLVSAAVGVLLAPRKIPYPTPIQTEIQDLHKVLRRSAYLLFGSAEQKDPG